MKNFKLYILLLLVFGTHKVINAQNELDMYLKIAADNNPELKAKFNDYMAAMEKVPQVSALPDPQLAFGYFIQTPETRVGPQTWNVSLMQRFPWFGLLKTQADAATEMAKAKYELFEQAKSNLFFEVKTTYYNYYFVVKAIDITKENLSILQILKNYTLIKIESGKTTIADQLRVEIEINEVENQLLLLMDKKKDLEVKFNNLLNKETPLVIPDSLEDSVIIEDFTTIMDSIFLNNHQLKSIDFKIASFAEKEVAAKKMGMPSFSLGIGYTNVGNSNNPMIDASENGKDILMFPSFSISIPLYRKKYKGMVNEAKYLQEAQISSKQNTKNFLNTVFEKVNTDYLDADRRIKLNNKQYLLAKKALNVLMTAYSADAKDFDDVLRMERLLLKFQLEKEKALADKNSSMAFIDYLMGR